METLREKLKNRNQKSAKDKALRQIKMAEIYKNKEKEKEAAKEFTQPENEGMTDNAALNTCIDKVSMMQRLAWKQEYSRPVYIKRHLINQAKLNAFLGIGFDVDWVSSKRDSEIPDDQSEFSVKTADLKQLNDDEAVTYDDLLRHIR